MTEVSFTSTYRIPLVEQGISRNQREALKKLADMYENAMYPKGNNGFVRISISEGADERFVQKLKQLGFKVYQKFSRHDVPVENGEMDRYIKSELDTRNYRQYGKQMKAKSRH